MKRFLLSTLHGKLIFSFLGVALLPILLLAYINKQTTQKTLTDNANQALLNAANQTAFSLDAFIFNNLNAIRVEAQLPEIISYADQFSEVEPDDKDEMAKIFNALSSKDSLYILSYSLLDRQGRNILDTNSANIGKDKSQWDYFQRPFQTGLPYVSPLRIEPADKVASLYFSSPVRNASGKIIGVLCFRYSAVAIQRVVTQSNNLVAGGAVAILLDENHIRLAQAQAPELIFKSVIPLLPKQVKTLQGQGRLLNSPGANSTRLLAFARGLAQVDKSPFFTAPIDGTDNLNSVAVVRLQTQLWYVAFVQPQTVFFAPIQAQARNILLLALVIAALVVMAAVVVGQRLAQPLTDLAKVVSRFTAGDTAARTTIRSRDEIGVLAASFNTMATQVGKLVLGLEERTQELEVSQSVTAAVSELSCVIREPERLLQEAIALMQNRFGLHYVQIYLVHPVTQQLVRWAGSGKQNVVPEEDTLIGFEQLDMLIVRAAQTQEIVWADDSSSSSEIGSEIAIPLIARGTFLGVLDLQNDPNYRFKREDLGTFNTLAGQIAIALENAHLFKDVQKAETQYRQKATQLEQTLLELQQTQTQLIQTEKMSSLGQLVAGVAHEINNPVNFIYGNLTHVSDYTTDLLSLIELYQQHYFNNSEIRDRIEEIDLEFLIEDLPKTLSSMRVGADRIRSIVLTLRNFSRLDEADMKPVNLHEGIDSTLLILQSRLKAAPDRPGIEIIKDYGDLPEVECYAGQLNQVFMNLINNAIDSLHQWRDSLDDNTNYFPAIAIRTQIIQKDWVAISIKDNGFGMNDAVKAQLFNPFFTTKKVGEGTGLGLSISYQIVVDKHGGRMKCISNPGEGAEFILEIPLRQHHPSNTSKTKVNTY